MLCPHCAASIPDGALICAACRHSISQPQDEVRLSFEGDGVEVLGWGLLIILGSILIIPGAWVVAAASRWFCRNLRFSDGTTAQFNGTGGEIVGWWILYVLLGGVHFQVGHIRLWPFDSVAVRVSCWPLAIAVALVLIRWLVANVQLSSGASFRFTGGYWPLLGWYVLNSLAIVTIVGWAWSLAATYRWFADHTRSKEFVLRFEGAPTEILWRVLVALLLSIPIVTVPWVWLWYTRWLVRNVSMERRAVDALRALPA